MLACRLATHDARTNAIDRRREHVRDAKPQVSTDYCTGTVGKADHYLTAVTPSQRQAMDALVEDAQHDLLRRAHPPAVITGEDAAGLARDYPQIVSALRLDDTVIAELVSGTRDVFTAACADQLSGLHGPKGKPCPARPWVCLLCPLAVFAPRHAANLLRLKAFFSRQWQQMPCRPLHGGLRALLPARHPGAGSLRPGRRRGCRRQRRGQR